MSAAASLARGPVAESGRVQNLRGGFHAAHRSWHTASGCRTSEGQGIARAVARRRIRTSSSPMAAKTSRRKGSRAVPGERPSVDDRCRAGPGSLGEEWLTRGSGFRAHWGISRRWRASRPTFPPNIRHRGLSELQALRPDRVSRPPGGAIQIRPRLQQRPNR